MTRNQSYGVFTNKERKASRARNARRPSSRAYFKSSTAKTMDTFMRAQLIKHGMTPLRPIRKGGKNQ